MFFTRRVQSSKPESLWPEQWDEFEGHERIKELLRGAWAAAERAGRLPPNVLLWGPPGCGKTALARLLAGRRRCRVISGPGLKAPELAAAVLNTRAGMLVIEELHGLDREAQEVLQPVLDEGVLYWGRQSVAVGLVVIGTTTRLGRVVKPLRERFELVVNVPKYGDEEIRQIAERVAAKLGVELTERAQAEVPVWARGVPRWVVRILKRARDRAEGGVVNRPAVLAAVADLGFDEWGLLPEERSYLEALMVLGGRSGVQNIAAMLRVRRDDLVDIEGWLLEAEYIRITGRGRELTLKALEMLSVPEDEG